MDNSNTFLKILPENLSRNNLPTSENNTKTENNPVQYVDVTRYVSEESRIHQNQPELETRGATAILNVQGKMLSQNNNDTEAITEEIHSRGECNITADDLLIEKSAENQNDPPTFCEKKKKKRRKKIKQENIEQEKPRKETVDLNKIIQELNNNVPTECTLKAKKFMLHVATEPIVSGRIHIFQSIVHGDSQDDFETMEICDKINVIIAERFSKKNSCNFTEDFSESLKKLAKLEEEIRGLTNKRLKYYQYRKHPKVRVLDSCLGVLKIEQYYNLGNSLESKKTKQEIIKFLQNMLKCNHEFALVNQNTIDTILDTDPSYLNLNSLFTSLKTTKKYYNCNSKYIIFDIFQIMRQKCAFIFNNTPIEKIYAYDKDKQTLIFNRQSETVETANLRTVNFIMKFCAICASNEEKAQKIILIFNFILQKINTSFDYRMMIMMIYIFTEKCLDDFREMYDGFLNRTYSKQQAKEMFRDIFIKYKIPVNDIDQLFHEFFQLELFYLFAKDTNFNTAILFVAWIILCGVIHNDIYKDKSISDELVDMSIDATIDTNTTNPNDTQINCIKITHSINTLLNIWLTDPNRYREDITKKANLTTGMPTQEVQCLNKWIKELENYQDNSKIDVANMPKILKDAIVNHPLSNCMPSGFGFAGSKNVKLAKKYAKLVQAERPFLGTCLLFLISVENQNRDSGAVVTSEMLDIAHTFLELAKPEHKSPYARHALFAFAQTISFVIENVNISPALYKDLSQKAEKAFTYIGNDGVPEAYLMLAKMLAAVAAKEDENNLGQSICLYEKAIKNLKKIDTDKEYLEYQKLEKIALFQTEIGILKFIKSDSPTKSKPSNKQRNVNLVTPAEQSTTEDSDKAENIDLSYTANWYKNFGTLPAKSVLTEQYQEQLSKLEFLKLFSTINKGISGRLEEDFDNLNKIFKHPYYQTLEDNVMANKHSENKCILLRILQCAQYFHYKQCENKIQAFDINFKLFFSNGKKVTMKHCFDEAINIASKAKHILCDTPLHNKEDSNKPGGVLAESQILHNIPVTEDSNKPGTKLEASQISHNVQVTDAQYRTIESISTFWLERNEKDSNKLMTMLEASLCSTFGHLISIQDSIAGRKGDARRSKPFFDKADEINRDRIEKKQQRQQQKQTASVVK